MYKIIDFDNSYEFVFLDDSTIKIMHPVSEYYLKLNDTSVNILISLKWLKWSYVFMTLLSKNLDNLDNDYNFPSLINKSIQVDMFDNIPTIPHILIIDNNIIDSLESLDNLINNLYNQPIFDENTKIHVKLKINLIDYLIISNCLFPTFIKYD